MKNKVLYLLILITIALSVAWTLSVIKMVETVGEKLKKDGGLKKIIQPYWNGL